MTRHPFNPTCDCDFCFAEDLNAVLLRFVEQRRKRTAADVDEHNSAAVRMNVERDAWADTLAAEVVEQARVG